MDDTTADLILRNLFSYGNYNNISITEGCVIGQYYNDYDPKLIVMMLNSDIELSNEMRKFIADVLAGKIKRPKGKRSSTRQRNLLIHQEICDLLSDDVRLTSNSEKNGAAFIVADKFSISEDAAIKAYQRIESEMDDARRAVSELQSFLFMEKPTAPVSMP